MKVVINTRIGGFHLSREGLAEYVRQKGFTPRIVEDDHYGMPAVYCENQQVYSMYIERSDPALVRTIEKLGEKADGDSAILKIVDIPDDVDYIICEHDNGREWIAEKHRTWD